MASQINPNSIDAAYPVAGQDNSTQGFRDNFNQIKINFQFAESEITQLQTASVQRGSGVNNDLDGAVIYNARLQKTSDVTYALGTVTSNAAVINASAANYQSLTLGNASVALSFSNFPAAGSEAEVTLAITVPDLGNSVVVFPSSVGNATSARSAQGIQGLTGNTLTFAETGTYELVVSTADGGSSVSIQDLTRPRNRWTNPLFVTGSEDLASGAAASLLKTTSYFATAAAETATLAAGTDGQIKVFCMSADLGNMVITVTNAGWKTSGTGTITFNDIGDACTLLYVNNKWYCIGNNGCAFA